MKNYLNNKSSNKFNNSHNHNKILTQSNKSLLFDIKDDSKHIEKRLSFDLGCKLILYGFISLFIYIFI